MEYFKLLPRISYVLQLLIYAAIASAVIKYVMPRWSLITNLGIGNLANVDVINIAALYLISMPVLLLVFILWLKR